MPKFIVVTEKSNAVVVAKDAAEIKAVLDAKKIAHELDEIPDGDAPDVIPMTPDQL
jgi:hypothetical protein